LESKNAGRGESSSPVSSHKETSPQAARNDVAVQHVSAHENEQRMTIKKLEEQLQRRNEALAELQTELDDKEDELLEKDNRIHLLTKQITSKYQLKKTVVGADEVTSSFKKTSELLRVEALRKNLLQKEGSVRNKIVRMVDEESERSRRSLEMETEIREVRLLDASFSSTTKSDPDCGTSEIESLKQKLSKAESQISYQRGEATFWKQKALQRTMMEEKEQLNNSRIPPPDQPHILSHPNCDLASATPEPCKVETLEKQLAEANDYVQRLEREKSTLEQGYREFLEDELASQKSHDQQRQELEERLMEATANVKRVEEEKATMEQGFQEFLEDTLECLKKSEAEVEELRFQLDGATINTGKAAATQNEKMMMADDVDYFEALKERMAQTASQMAKAPWKRSLQPHELQLVETASDLLLEAGQDLALQQWCDRPRLDEVEEARDQAEADLVLYKKLLDVSNAKVKELNQELQHSIARERGSNKQPSFLDNNGDLSVSSTLAEI